MLDATFNASDEVGEVTHAAQTVCHMPPPLGFVRVDPRQFRPNRRAQFTGTVLRLVSHRRLHVLLKPGVVRRGRPPQPAGDLPPVEN